MLLKVSASSLISAAPRTGARSWNSPRLMARVEAASARIGVLMPTAKRYPRITAATGDDQHESQRLGVEFLDAGIIASLFQAALGDHRPPQIGNRAVGADQFRCYARFRPSVKRCTVAVVRKSLGSPARLGDDVRTRAGLRPARTGVYRDARSRARCDPRRRRCGRARWSLPGAARRYRAKPPPPACR